MNNTAEQILDILPAPGEPYGGGFYVGCYQIDGQEYALIVAPKTDGEHDDIRWHSNYDDILGATSYCDGLANTQAMAEAGSALAQWALALTINDRADWYLPAVDELELCYRALKPTTDENSQWARSGINLSSLLPAGPYTADQPAQTTVALFREDGDQAFAPGAYWSSTQHAALSGYAWGQGFDHGSQNGWFKNNTAFRARAVRRIKI